MWSKKQWRCIEKKGGCDVKSKKMKRQLLFFKLKLTKRAQTSLFSEDVSTLSEKVDQLSKNFNQADRFQVLENKIFTLISFDKAHIFGNYGKLEDFGDGDHVRNRNKEDLSIEDIEYLVETFSYFYIDLKKDDIVLIKRSGLPDIKKPLEKFLSTHFKISIGWKVEVIPEMSENIDNLKGKSVPVGKVKYSLSNENIPKNEFLSLNEISGINNSDIVEATVGITLKQGTETFIDKMIDKSDKYRDLKIENDEEEIDFIQNLVTKKVAISITKEQLKNQNDIKSLLMSALRTNLQ